MGRSYSEETGVLFVDNPGCECTFLFNRNKEVVAWKLCDEANLHRPRDFGDLKQRADDGLLVESPCGCAFLFAGDKMAAWHLCDAENSHRPEQHGRKDGEEILEDSGED